MIIYRAVQWLSIILFFRCATSQNIPTEGSCWKSCCKTLLVKINQNSKLRFLPRIGREVEGKNWKEKVNFSLSKFWILRREYVCKISFIWEEKFFFKISNSERRTRIFSSKSWQSRLYREMKIQFSSARETFPLEIFSRSRISSMPWRRGLCGCWGSLVGWSSLRWTKFYTNIVEY